MMPLVVLTIERAAITWRVKQGLIRVVVGSGTSERPSAQKGLGQASKYIEK
jgi:hypothetical protein